MERLDKGKAMAGQGYSRNRRRKGFEQASALIAADVRAGGESRGFAVSRLLTHWPEVAGEDIARIARPVEISYGRGFGATLTLLTTGANAPMVEMAKDRLKERVNACYGYAAVQKIRVTQTAATGFAEGKVDFAHAPKVAAPKEPPETKPEARRLTGNIGDPSLKAALERLGTNILSRTK